MRWQIPKSKIMLEIMRRCNRSEALVVIKRIRFTPITEITAVTNWTM